MTIIVATAAPNGLVLASDSRTTLRNGRRHRIASDQTRKVFAPCPGIGVATYGAALLAEQTIAGHMEGFSAQIHAAQKQGDITIDKVCEELVKYFSARLDEQAESSDKPPPGILGFVVAGYDARGVGLIYDVLLPPAEGEDPIDRRTDPSTPLPGYLYRGETQYARRLMEGYDVARLERSGVNLSAKVDEQLRLLRYVLNPPLAVQDAVDLAAFFVRLTIDMDRLSDGTLAEPEGVPVCGGALQVLVITSKGFTWVLQPELRINLSGIAEAG
jgi:hypothetical protein